MFVHESITEEHVIEAIKTDRNVGFCIACGETTYSIEPDARKYCCESCGEDTVYGAEELLFRLYHK